MDGSYTALISANTGMSIAGVGILSNIVSVPMALGLKIDAVFCCEGGVISKLISRRLLVKARKHDLIRVLCMSKLNTVSNRISTALIDGKMSDEGFKMIMDEIEKFQQMKTDKRAKTARTY